MERITIADACTLHARIGWQGLTKAEYLDEGDYYLITGVDFNEGLIDFENCHFVSEDRYIQDEHIQVAVSDVLVTKDGTIGKVAIVDKLDKPATLNSGVFVVRPRNLDELLPEFLVVALRSGHFTRFIEQIKVGCTIAHLNQEKFLKYDIPRVSVEEQRYIVETLSKAEQAIKHRKQEIQLLDNLIKARFVELFGLPGTEAKGWGLQPISEFCEVNPKKAKDTRLVSGLEVSFVPMPAVSENGNIDATEIRSYDDVKTGFTYFSERDVLFAKITPCMENGKGAVAVGLCNGVGFGSTEFHVLRPIVGKSNPYWIYSLTSFKPFRKDAESNMTGSAGQRRVPASFFEKYKVALPPVELQNQFEDFVKQVDKSKVAVQKALDEVQQLFDSLMQQYFG